MSQNVHGDEAEELRVQAKLKRIKPIRLISSSDARAAGSYREIPLATAAEAPLSERASDVLQKQTGVQVNRAGAPGTQSVLAIRGMSPDQVEYFIEGVPLPRPLATPPNLEMLPLPLFSAVDIYPSFVPSHLPGANIGGALNFRLLRPEGESARYLTQVSQNSLLGTSVIAARQTGSSLNFVSFEQSRNRYEYVSNNGTPENRSDDRVLQRLNEDFTRAGYTGFGTLAAGKWQIAGLADFYHSDRGIPGVQNLPIESARRSEQRMSGAVKAARPLSETLNVQLIATTSFDRSELTDPKRELIAATRQLSESPQLLAGASLAFRTNTVDAAVHTRAKYQSIAVDRGNIAARHEGQGTANAAYDTSLFRVAAQTGFTATQDNAAQNAFYASRETVFSTTGVSASGFVALRPLALFDASADRSALEVYAQATSAFRSPTLYERFGDGLFVTASEFLRSERAITNAAGVRGALNCPASIICSWRSEAWLTGAKDFILFTQNSSRTLIAVNASSAQIAGLENEVQLHLPEKFLLSLRYTYLDARDYGSIPYYQDKYLPFRPRHHAVATLTLLFGQLRSITSAEFRGAVFRDRYNSYGFYLPSKILVDSGIDYTLSSGATHILNFTVKNITDDRETDFIGYPLPGRYYLVRWTAQY
ncbi:TonB-dependent receptor plug domain-containing protein [Turneriella parva]|uniref:TonB-dependent receptor plug domain-containing protein n=1 Tax=Turneriella parva TaxID=29510 RepID=UPI0002F06125|nr:TonB-dependent receptor plug domain-containing protein [Turneriella parva]